MLEPASFGVFRITGLSLAVGLLWIIASDGVDAAWQTPESRIAEAARLLEKGQILEARELLETLPDESYEAYHLHGLLALAEKDFEKARTHFIHALEKQPGAFVTAYNLTLLYRAGGEFKKGLELMAPFLSSSELTDDQKAESHELTASLYELTGSPRKAAEHLYAALRLSPDEERYYYSLGSHLLSHLAFTEADRVIKAGCRRFPNSSRLFLALGTSAALQDNPDLAARAFVQAALLDPSDPLPYRNLAMLPSFALTHGEASEEITEALAKLVSDNPDIALLQYLVGISRLRKAQVEGDEEGIEDASARLRKAIEIDPGLAEAHHGLARLLLHQNHLEEALEAARRATQLSPDTPLYYYTMSRVLMLLGKTDESETWLASFRRLQKDQDRERRRQYELLSVLKAER